MRAFLYRVGETSAAHPWRVIGTWVAILVAAFGIAGVIGGTPHDNYNVPGLSSQSGIDLLRAHFPEFSGTDARVVVHSDDGPVAATELTELQQRLADVEGVSHVSPPRISEDGDTALIGLNYDIPVTDFQGTEGIDALRAATAAAEQSGLQVELGGEVPENVGTPSGTAEAIGIVVALVILLFVFGTIVAAGLPLLVALIGVGVGMALITIMAGFTDISVNAPSVAMMVGVGVGIDYALLLVTRFADALRPSGGVGGPDVVRRAAGVATSTAGVSVIFAGTTVLISLFGLRIAGLAVYSSFGYATFAMVTAVMLASITLVPAVCGLAGFRIFGRNMRRLAPRKSRHNRPPVTERWARRVGNRPLPYAVAALALLLLLAAPVLQMRTWPQDAGSQPTSNTTRLAYDLVAAEFGPGANGPFLVAVDLEANPAAALPTLANRLAADPGVAAVSPALIAPDGAAAVLEVVPSTGPADAATTDTMDRLRAQLPTDSYLTGMTPVLDEISDRLAHRLWLAIAVVVGLAVLLLTVAFRAPVVAIKAALMNLLAVAATYGVMVAVFQWGWGAGLLGLPHAVPVSSWVPLLIFTILFGLSMDYEVFLLSRVREYWLKSGDARESVTRGLSSTARVITGAGAIMVAVFAGYALDSELTIKMIGVGLATAVLLDVTVVRMILVPATMALLGRANWWLPSWLDRILPNLDIDGNTAPDAPARAPKEEPVPAKV
ncbi:MMPL family transporter [Aldersonia sp. NBC_00410]|uniref:MMPL family transporter n=1 Tax=Aldersonia sp. NBC_00410 TaxID=2975954 RepID=UPI00225BB15B|nr:MMPL family transporter [Aldersonia sp. NBC_00410]MCX5043804.1 MMPL family transporter [Aldersonia sp. NBC_00410]